MVIHSLFARLNDLIDLILLSESHDQNCVEFSNEIPKDLVEFLEQASPADEGYPPSWTESVQPASPLPSPRVQSGQQFLSIKDSDLLLPATVKPVTVSEPVPGPSKSICADNGDIIVILQDGDKSVNDVSLRGIKSEKICPKKDGKIKNSNLKLVESIAVKEIISLKQRYCNCHMLL